MHLLVLIPQVVRSCVKYIVALKDICVFQMLMDTNLALVLLAVVQDIVRQVS